MNFSTQIKCTATALALFAAVGFAALTSAAVTRMAGDDARARVEVGAPITLDSPAIDLARVHVGTPIAVDANPTAEDIERASR